MNKQKYFTLISGLLAVFFAIAIPFLPVKQETATVKWPQEKFGNILLPLVSYAPEKVVATISCQEILAAPKDATFISSVPLDRITSSSDTFLMRNNPKPDAKNQPNFEIFSGGSRIAAFELNKIREWGCSQIVFENTWDKTTVNLDGVPGNIAEENKVELTEKDLRPQITGIFTSLNNTSSINVEILTDSRYTINSTLIRNIFTLLAVIFTIITLLGLRKLDNFLKPIPEFKKNIKTKLFKYDAIVLGLLILWYFIGANTSDDGYILTMSRTAFESNYPANYYRWFGAPEAPFGWYYYIFSLLAKISTASIWMRLPSLICGIGTWYLLSRFVIPKLGPKVKNNKHTYLAAGLTMLAFWLPLNNGLRPEPIIAFGTLLTWCLFEITISTKRLYPASLGLLVAGLTIGAGPTGLITIGIILVSLPTLISIIISRAKELNGKFSDYLTFTVPLVAACTFFIVYSFQKLTIKSFMVKANMQTYLGPSNKWFDEPARYSSLMGFSEDGPLMRRFPMFLIFIAIVIIGLIIIRKGKITGVSKAVTLRIIAAIGGSFFLMIFTPTKWTHHFGVFAGIAAALSPVLIMVLTPEVIKSKINRLLISAASLFLIAFAFTGPNKWWSYSNYGVPWRNSAFKLPLVVKDISLGTILFFIAIIVAIMAGFIFIRKNNHEIDLVSKNFIEKYQNKKIFKKFTWNGSLPVTLLLSILLFTEFVSMGWAAAISQKDSYSVAKGNLNALKGKTCGLSEYILVEENSNQGFMKSENTTLKSSLNIPSRIDYTDEGKKNIFSNGFGPENIKEFLIPKYLNQNLYSTGYNPNYQDTTLGKAFNKPHLPYGLDSNNIPVMGNWFENENRGGQLTSDWFTLPEAKQGKVEASKDLITVSAAGRFDSHEIVLEYSLSNDPKNRIPETKKRVQFHDAGFYPMWRNLRIQRNELPKEAKSIRLIVSISETAIGHWAAVTPPRIPKLTTLQKLVGKDSPVLIDWTSGFAFPCQKPFSHRTGIAEIPEWRIQPNLKLSEGPNDWENAKGGGPLGWQQILSYPVAVPSYLINDLNRDWGELSRLVPYYENAEVAKITIGSRTNSALFSPAPVRYKEKDAPDED